MTAPHCIPVAAPQDLMRIVCDNRPAAHTGGHGHFGAPPGRLLMVGRQGSQPPLRRMQLEPTVRFR
jgi:hypothetical protein